MRAKQVIFNDFVTLIEDKFGLRLTLIPVEGARVAEIIGDYADINKIIGNYTYKDVDFEVFKTSTGHFVVKYWKTGQKTLSVTVRFGTNPEHDQRFQTSFERIIFGKTKEELFKNLEEKIWALTGREAIILDEDIRKEYNEWIARQAKMEKVPTEIDNWFYRRMNFSLKYSERYRLELQNNSIKNGTF